MLREVGYNGEIKATGDVLVDLVFFMRRCGFDSFAPNVPFNDADVQGGPQAATRMSTRMPPTPRCRSGTCAIRNSTMASRAVDVIDTGPRFTQADADALNARFAGVDAGDDAARAVRRGHSSARVAVVSSFGTESAVLLHLVAQADPTVPVIFVDTLKMFHETLAYREQLIEQLRPRSIPRSCSRDAGGARGEGRKRAALVARTPTAAARSARSSRSSAPSRASTAWISGRKAFQSVTRQNLPRFEVEDGRLKINPLGDWTKARPRRLLRGARPAAPPARGARLPLGRLPAVHQHRRSRAKTRARAAGAAGTRPSAASTDARTGQRRRRVAPGVRAGVLIA